MAAKRPEAESLDFTGVTSGGGRRIHVPEGDYLLIAKSVEETSSKNKNKMWVMTFKFESGPKKGREIRDNFVLVPQAMFRVKNLLEAMGYSVPDGKMKVDPNKIVAQLRKKPIGAYVVDDEPYQGHTPSTIARYIPAGDVVESPDEADEDPEEDEPEDDEEWEDDLGDDGEWEEDEEPEADEAYEDEGGEDADLDDEDEEGEWTEEDLEALDLAELKAVAKEHGVPVKKGKRSATYIAEILATYGEEDDEEEEEPEPEPEPKPRPRKKATKKTAGKKSSVVEELEDLDLDELA